MDRAYSNKKPQLPEPAVCDCECELSESPNVEHLVFAGARTINVQNQQQQSPTIADVTLMINPQLPDPHHQLCLLAASLVVDEVIGKKLFELANCQQLYAGCVTDLRQQDSSMFC